MSRGSQGNSGLSTNASSFFHASSFATEAGRAKMANDSYNLFKATGSSQLLAPTTRLPMPIPAPPIYSAQATSGATAPVDLSINAVGLFKTPSFATAVGRAKMANDSYDLFKATGSSQLLAPIMSPAVPTPPPTSSSIISDDSLGAAVKAMGKKLILNGSEHYLPGSRNYLGPKFTIHSLVSNTHTSYQQSLAEGSSPAEALACGMLAAGATRATTTLGYSALGTMGASIFVADAAVGTHGPAGALGAFALMTAGSPAVEAAGQVVGEATRTSCHAAFNFSRNSSALMPPPSPFTPSAHSSLNSDPPLIPHLPRF